MTKKRALWERMMSRLELPREALPFSFGLSLSGQGELVLYGCRGILRYEREEIVFAVWGREVWVQGEGLSCTAFGAGGVTVKGQISSVSFREGLA